MPNSQEILLFSLLVLKSGRSATELNQWASKVLLERPSALELGAAWSPPDTPDWRAKGTVGPLWVTLRDAVVEISWPTDVLSRVAGVMQSYYKTGQQDGLDRGHLRRYLALLRDKKKPLPGPASKHTPPRWKTGAICEVANIVLREGPPLRKLLNDPHVEEGPTALDRAAAAEACVKKVEVERDQAVENLRKKCDAHRKLKGASKKRRATVGEAVQKERKKAKTDISKKSAEIRAAEQKKLEERLAAAVARKLKAKDEEISLLTGRVAWARKRARLCESAAEQAPKHLKRARDAEATIKRLQAQLESLEDDESESEAEEPSPLLSRRDERGRFQVDDPLKRWVIWSQLGAGVSPQRINQNITETLFAYAPEASRPINVEATIRRMRGEVTIAGEMMAALQLAQCRRIISFGFDESTKWGLGIFSTNLQIEPRSAPGTSIDIIPRGATLTAGGTAEAIASDIDVKIFSHCRRMINLFKQAYEKRQGIGSWKRDGLPDPDCVGIHMLASSGALVMSDTCNAARACKRLVATAAETAARERIGEAAWTAMTEPQRALSCKCFLGDCNDHMRNIIVKGMASAATEYLKQLLGDSLSEFSAYDRMSADVMDLLRGACKELHPNGEYAKGKGRECFAWRVLEHSSDMWLPIANTSGSRQDIVFDGCPPLYMNRLQILDFLADLIGIPGANNILEKFLWRTLKCNEIVAALRTFSLFQLLVTDPLRWTTGKAATLDEWSVISSNEMLDLTYDAMVDIAADGSKLFDVDFDPFSPVAAKQKNFDKWRTQQQSRAIKAADGTPYEWHKATLAELRNPVRKGNKQSTSIAIELAKRMAGGALIVMRDPKRSIADKLTSQDGENCVSKNTDVHERTIGAHVMNSLVESNFGIYDRNSRTYRNTKVENMSCMVQQSRNKDFELPPNVAHDRRKSKSARTEQQHTGFYHIMRPELQHALVDAVVSELPFALQAGRVALADHDQAKINRRGDRRQHLLEKAVEQYAYSIELFEQWQTQGVNTAEDVNKMLRGKSEAQQLEDLRLQIEMRVLGLGWSQFSTRWSSKQDSSIGTVSHLKQLLVGEILPEEKTMRRLKKLPTEAAPPHYSGKDVGTLGTADADALEVEAKSLFSKEELKLKAQAALKRREEAGISDSVERLQPKQAPPFDQMLVGKWIEILWKYFDKDTKQPTLIWATGRVIAIADGLTNKRSSRARKILPAGGLLWAWEADKTFDERAGEQWLILLPSKWNKHVHYGWRLDPRELKSAAAKPPATPHQRAQNKRRAQAELSDGTDDER